jgi:hypothetical protein
MKRLIQIIRLPQLQPLHVMACVFTELCTAFAEDDACEVVCATEMNQLRDGGIAFLDDVGGEYVHYRPIYDEIAQRCPNTVFVCWYWMNTTFRPFSKMLYTGEYLLNVSPDNKEQIAYFMRPDFVPLKLRASEHPDKVGTYSRIVTRDYCYMGGGYRMDWVPQEYTGIYHRVIYTNYLPYDMRRDIYLSSMFALGFQSDANIKGGHLSQRIFEGLAYGCIVLCENPMAAQYTDGTVVYISSKEDLVEKIKYYKSHPQEAERLQRRGYEWVKKHGTNRVTTSLIKERIADLFHDDFTNEPKYVYVDVMGGLGNQLFQLATAYAYARKEGGQLMIYERQENGKRPVYWNSACKHFQPYLVSKEMTYLPKWTEQSATVYTPIPSLDSSGKQLCGYFQSDKYFNHKEIRNEIKALLETPQETKDALEGRYGFLLANRERVVVIHSRRTDYVTCANVHGPLEGSYYRAAIQRICSLVKDPIIVLCGDDPTYWKTIQEDISSVYPHNCFMIHDETDVNTFALLQQFHNFIMSNSTFIWWCVWMSSSKHVIAPSRWFGPDGPKEYEDIYLPEWERM